jgi:hypothetical protein
VLGLVADVYTDQDSPILEFRDCGVRAQRVLRNLILVSHYGKDIQLVSIVTLPFVTKTSYKE